MMPDLQYNQNEKRTVPGTDGRTRNKVKCFNLEEWGHFTDKFPKVNQDDTQMLQIDQDQKTEEEDSDGHDDGMQQYNSGYDIKPDDDLIIESFQYFNRDINKMISQVKNNGGNDLSILIDTCSTFSAIKDLKMVTDIKNSRRILRAVSNRGNQDHNKKASLPGFFEVWFNGDSKLNILAWVDVRKVSNHT